MMQNSISFTVYGRPQPQGSSSAFPILRANGKMGASVTSANKKLRPYRQEVAWCAQLALNEAGVQKPFAGKHVAVMAEFKYFFERPASVSKKRIHHVVKPDFSKLFRATEDALTGFLYADDSQVVSPGRSAKFYGSPERTEITVSIVRMGQEKLFEGAK